MSIYKNASQRKLRFHINGVLSTEQLLSVDKNVLISYEEQLQEEVEKLGKGSSRRKKIQKSKEVEELELRLAIVTDVLNTIEEIEERNTTAATTKAEEQELLALLEEKEKEERLKMSKEEILAKLAELKGKK